MKVETIEKTNNSEVNTTSPIMRGEGVKFIRIRRITGYLVGSVERWGTPKKNELADRVKHSF